MNSNTEFKVVGSTCVADFTGHESPEAILRLFDILGQAALSCSEFETNTSFRSEPGSMSLRTYMGYVAMAVRTCGWVSKTVARDRGVRSTAKEVQELVYDKKLPTEADVARGNKAVDSMMIYLDWELEKGELNDYLHNVLVVCHFGVVTAKTEGVAASILSVAEREMQKWADKDMPTGYIGTEGQRLAITGTVLESKIVLTGFGNSTLVKMSTDQGRVAFWDNVLPSQVPPGLVMSVKGTVKQHRTSYNVQETTLNRVEYVTADEAAAFNLKQAKKAAREAKKQAALDAASETK